MHRFTCTRDRIVRTDKPAHLGIIVPAVEVIQPRLCIVVVPPVAEGVGVACRPAVGVLHRALAPCVVAVLRSKLAAYGVCYGYDVALQIIDIVVKMIVRISKTNTITSRVVEEPHGALSGLLRQNLTAVEEILRGDAVDRLARPYPVGVIGEAQRIFILCCCRETATLPSHIPAEIARRVADGVVGNGLAVVGRQQITPGAVAVGVADRMERRAKLAGGVVIFALTQDIAAGIIFVGKRLALRRAVVANQLVFTIVGILFAQRIVFVGLPCAFGGNIAIGII